jgi:hypothetical protein
MQTFGKMFNKVAPGMCRLSMNGIAINVNGEYKTYDVNSGMLVNCADFVFDVGDDMFFVIPTNNVLKGDILLASSGPVCVIEVKDNEIRAFDYKSGTIVSLVPERYVCFGATYFYSKIVSPFANITAGGDMNKIMPIMMMSSMSKDGGDMSKMMAMSMMMNSGFNFNDMFGGMFGTPLTEKAPTIECDKEAN